MVNQTLNKAQIIFLISIIVSACDQTSQEINASKYNSDAELITIENWISYPEIKQIRLIYNEIIIERKNNNIKEKKKIFDVKSEKCRSQHTTYISKTIGYDVKRLVRYFKETEYISPNSVGATEYFLDKNGITRFMFLTLGDKSHNVRVYFNKKGIGIFSVEQIDGKYVKDRLAVTDYTPLSAKKLEELFSIKSSCPVIEKIT